MPIRSRLILLILSVLLPAAFAGGLAIWFVYDEQLDAQEQSLSEAARVLSQLIDNEIESGENSLLALAASPDLTAGRLEEFYQHARVLSNNGRRTFVLSDMQGRQLLNTRVPFGDALPATINPRMLELRGQTDAQRTLVSDLFFAPLGKRYDFATQVPVVLDGKVRYYLSRGVEAAEIQSLLDRQGFPRGWIATIMDRKGTVIARVPDASQYLGKSSTGGLSRKVLSGVPHGVNDGVSLDGRPVKAFFHRAPKSGWTAVLSVPKSKLREPAIRASLLLAALILLTFVGAMLRTQRYLRKILTPIQRLRNDARRMGQGQTIEAFQSGLSELDEVSTALVSANQELQQANSTLQQRVAEAVDATERAQRALLQSQKLEALGRLTGGVAHDFNNVLQTLTSALQLIRLEADPARIPQRIALCERAVERATSLVAQLRAFGRVQDAYLVTVNVGEAVRGMLPMLQSCLPSGIALDTSIPATNWPVRVDVAQLELALLNLVMNARDAITGQGRVGISVSNVAAAAHEGLPAGDYVCIEIRDTGAGMSAEVLAKAFDPFYTTKPLDKGTGLGLPQAYGFATQSHGTLKLASSPGAGTVATLYLPRAQPAVAVAAEAPADTAHLVPLRGTVLFVEDDALVRESVTPVLAQAGAEVLSADNGEAALRILESGRHIDIVFSDVVMPGAINGAALARIVRERWPHLPVVLATGYVDTGIDMPDVALVTKPYQPKDVVAVLAGAARVAAPG